MISRMFYNWYHYAQPFWQEANAQLVIDVSREDNKEFRKMSELGDHHMLIHPGGGLYTISMIRTQGPHICVPTFAAVSYM